jgi:hypothetical protein
MMQTFLPYADFDRTTKCLDWRRLGKQRVEAMQIHNIITGKKTGGWSNHPAVKMWKGCANALALYHNACIKEWVNRGYNNNMSLIKTMGKIIYPFWFGDERFHSAHRQTLLSKNLEWYSQFGWKEIPKYEYVWPV